MADTKISALAAASAAAGANELPINEAGTSKKVTATQLKTFANTNPVLAAQDATHGAIYFTPSATLETTAEDGALEMDAECLYGCTDAGNRGLIPVINLLRADATVTQANDANAHAIFTTPTNGRITLETGVYQFSGVMAWTSMSATGGNIKVDLLGAGTAVATHWLWVASGNDSAATASAGAGSSWTNTSASPASVVAGTTATACGVLIQGTVKITTGGTLIPTQTVATAAAAVLSVGSFISFWRIGGTGRTSLGQWD